MAGPQPDWDPDIVAALDEDFDYSDPDNLLEDDFILQANAGGLETEAVDDNMDGRRRWGYRGEKLKIVGLYWTSLWLLIT